MVDLAFEPDEREIRRAREALTQGKGPAWFEEVGLAFLTRLTVGETNLLATSEQREDVWVAAATGPPSERNVRSVTPTVRLPLLDVVSAARRAFLRVSVIGEATWRLPGGGTVTFELSSPEMVRIRVSGLAPEEARAEARADELRAAFDEFTKEAMGYLDAQVPELRQFGAWMRWFDEEASSGYPEQ